MESFDQPDDGAQIPGKMCESVSVCDCNAHKFTEVHFCVARKSLHKSLISPGHMRPKKKREKQYKS